MHVSSALLPLLAASMGLFLGEAPLDQRSCVGSWNEARYRSYGYDHIVHLESRCTDTAYCTVTTDSNPQGVTVAVPASEHVEVLMFRGSSARAFTSMVRCSQ